METDQKLSIVLDPFTVNFIRLKAKQLCKRTDFSLSDFDDITQDMRLHLWKKAHLFDPTRGNVEAFVTRVLKSWVGMALRYRKRRRRSESYKAVSLERTKVLHEGDITTLGRVLLEEDGRRLTRIEFPSSFEQIDLLDAVEHSLKHLQPNDRAILVHVAENNAVSAARVFGISRRQVHNAMDRVRTQFKKTGLWSD